MDQVLNNQGCCTVKPVITWTMQPRSGSEGEGWGRPRTPALVEDRQNDPLGPNQLFNFL